MLHLGLSLSFYLCMLLLIVYAMVLLLTFTYLDFQAFTSAHKIICLLYMLLLLKGGMKRK